MRISEIHSKNGRTASYAVLERSFQNGPFNGMGKNHGTSVPPSAGKTGVLVFPALGGTKEIVQLLQPAMDDVVQVPSPSGDSGGDSTISSGDSSTSIPSEERSTDHVLKVISVDRPGTGQTSRPETNDNFLQAAVADALAVLETEAITRVYIMAGCIGHSLGMAVAKELLDREVLCGHGHDEACAGDEQQELLEGHPAYGEHEPRRSRSMHHGVPVPNNTSSGKMMKMQLQLPVVLIAPWVPAAHCPHALKVARLGAAIPSCVMRGFASVFGPLVGSSMASVKSGSLFSDATLGEKAIGKNFTTVEREAWGGPPAPGGRGSGEDSGSQEKAVSWAKLAETYKSFQTPSFKLEWQFLAQAPEPPVHKHCLAAAEALFGAAIAEQAVRSDGGEKQQDSAGVAKGSRPAITALSIYTASDDEMIPVEASQWLAEEYGKVLSPMSCNDSMMKRVLCPDSSHGGLLAGGGPEGPLYRRLLEQDWGFGMAEDASETATSLRSGTATLGGC